MGQIQQNEKTFLICKSRFITDSSFSLLMTESVIHDKYSNIHHNVVFYQNALSHYIICLRVSSSVLEFHDSLPSVLIRCFILSYAMISNWGSFMFNYLLFEEIYIMLNRLESHEFDLLKMFNEM